MSIYVKYLRYGTGCLDVEPAWDNCRCFILSDSTYAERNHCMIMMALGHELPALCLADLDMHCEKPHFL